MQRKPSSNHVRLTSNTRESFRVREATLWNVSNLPITWGCSLIPQPSSNTHSSSPNRFNFRQKQLQEPTNPVMGEDRDIKASQTPFSTFTLFPRLPLELRLQIWFHAIPVGAYIQFYRRGSPYGGESKRIISRCSDHAVPSLLHTNAESRAVALPYFHLLGTGSSQIYFNPTVDTLMASLHFRCSLGALVESPETILGENAALIKHIAVYSKPSYCYWYQRPCLKNFVRSLESFVVLDLSEWEVACRTGFSKQHPNGYLSYSAMRVALRAEVFRAENLVRSKEDELQLNDCCLERQATAFSASQAFVAHVGYIWKTMSERPLDLKVMRLPLPAAKMEDAREKMEREIAESILYPIRRPKKEGESVTGKRRGGRSLKWRLLGRLLSKFWL